MSNRERDRELADKLYYDEIAKFSLPQVIEEVRMRIADNGIFWDRSDVEISKRILQFLHALQMIEDAKHLTSVPDGFMTQEDAVA